METTKIKEFEEIRKNDDEENEEEHTVCIEDAFSNEHKGVTEIILHDNCYVAKTSEIDSKEINLGNEIVKREEEKETTEEKDGKENNYCQQQAERDCSETLHQNGKSHDITLNDVKCNDVKLSDAIFFEETEEEAEEEGDSFRVFSTWNQQKAFCPIADMRGVDSLNYSKAEKHLRCKLAAAYRLADIYGWAPDGVNANLTALTNKNEILLAPEGLFLHEMTASSFAKLSIEDGKMVDAGSTNLSFDLNELNLHLAIYSSREEMRCVIHMTSPMAVSFSALKFGLLPLCSEAMELGEITCFEYYEGLGQQDLVLSRIQQSKVLFLKNNGFIACGETVEQTFHTANNVIDAIRIQLNISHLGVNNFYLPSEEKQQIVFDASAKASSEIIPSRLDRRFEDVSFEGQMRMLDAAGYQTGYLYRFPFNSKRKLRSQSMVEVAPSAKLSPIASEYSSLRLGCNESVRSVTPSYFRHEKLRTSKSVMEKKSKRSNLTQQFIPLGTNIGEYKRKVKEIRKDFLPKASSGPQSNVLDGMTWEEARLNQVENDEQSPTGVTKVTVASRGIIQRDFQKSATFYKGYSASNPFGSSKQTEIEDYVKEIQKKTSSSRENEEGEEASGIQRNIFGNVNAEDAKKSKTNTDDLAEKCKDKTEHEEKIRNNNHVTESAIPFPAYTPEAPMATAEEVIPCSSVSEEGVRSFHMAEDSSGLANPRAEVSTGKPETSAKVTFAPDDSDTREHLPMSSSVSASKSSKMKKSISVNENDGKKQESESVELRGKDKEKKKKRGLSAIFSKKKES